MLFTPQLSGSTTTRTTNTASTTSTTSASTVTTTTTTTITSDFTWTLTEQSSGFNGINQVDDFCVPYTSTVNSIKTPVMTYREIQGMVSKWNIELEDQQRNFYRYASQINAWDHSLMENGEKITILHGEVEKVKNDQKRLEQELDFILSQQKELENLLIPLEDSLKDQNGSVFLQHVDQETDETYKAAENIDAQLKRMTQDLENITKHLSSFGNSDSADPLQHICKILSSHVDSLQWIDENSGILQRKVEEVSQILAEQKAMEQSHNARIDFD